MNELLKRTLSEIVTENYQTAAVFENYGLDFCCKGKRPLAQACEEKEISSSQVLEDLTRILQSEKRTSDYDKMSLTELAEYIVRVHHTYVKLNLPQIFSYVLRVASKHGDRFPYMKEVYILFAELKEEFEHHMMKEESVLFPRIKLLELNASGANDASYLTAPIDVMENDHERAGTIMQEIRTLTNNYTAPEGACTTFRLTLDSLKAFEEDLHQHVHLENNILFPKALKLFSAPATCSIPPASCSIKR